MAGFKNPMLLTNMDADFHQIVNSPNPVDLTNPLHDSM